MFCVPWLHSWPGEVSCDAVLCILWGFTYVLIFTLEELLGNAESPSPAERRELGDRHRLLWQQGWAGLQVQHCAHLQGAAMGHLGSPGCL